MNSNRIRWYRLAALTVSLFILLRTGYSILNNLDEVKGYEAHWIATALVEGHGFSMPNPEPWGIDIMDSVYHVTAWADPLYTYILASFLWLFGPSHQLAAAIFNLILLFASLELSYFLGERLISPLAGSITVLILATNSRFLSAVAHMNNTLLATALIGLSAFMLIRFAEKPSNRRAVELGLTLGITTLGCPNAQYFVFVAAIAIVIIGWKNLRTSAVYAMLAIGIALLIILPWNLRNYHTFDTYVPIRTGGGWGSFLGIVATAVTVSPEKLNTDVKPPWRVSTIREAVRLNTKRKVGLDKFQMLYAYDVVGPKFFTMNEAQRDLWFLNETKKFIWANPLQSAEIAVRNMEVFVRTMSLPGILVCFFAGIGALLAVRTPVILTLVLWVGAYIAPFFLILCYYNRYRSPVEPLLVLLALFAIWRLFQIVANPIKSPPPKPSAS